MDKRRQKPELEISKMKRNRTEILFSITFLGLFSLFLLFSCAKEQDEPEEPTTATTGTVPANSSFKWTAGSTAQVIADSAVCYVQITTIYAYKGGTSKTVEINLS